MKGLLKKWLFGDTELKTFYSVRGKDEEIKETVFLRTPVDEIDVSLTHAVICLEPIQIGFFLPKEKTIDATKKLWLEIRLGPTLRSSIEILFIETVDVNDTRFHICQVVAATSFQVSVAKQNLLLKLFLKNQATSDITERQKMAALYAYPRKVILVSVKDNDYLNIFPMDLQCYLPELGLQVLGLRTTNVALDKILQLKKVVVSDTQNIGTDVVLELGKHHLQAPGREKDLPFKTIESEIFKFPVVAASGAYREIEILFHKNIGSHTLMIGKALHVKKLQALGDDLFHLHVFEYLGSGYKQ